MATFKKAFLVTQYPEKSEDRDLAAAIGLAEGAIAVVRFQFSPESDVMFGTCESEAKMQDYLAFHDGTVLWPEKERGPADPAAGAREVPCPACRQTNVISRDTPAFGTAIICCQCKASLVRVGDPVERPYMPPREVQVFLGYHGCSLLHARCPSCSETTYSIVVPERGCSVSYYWNREQENPNAAFVVNVSCPHCEKPYVIEWDVDPR